MVSPGSKNRLHHGREAKCVDAGTFREKGWLLPNDGTDYSASGMMSRAVFVQRRSVRVSIAGMRG